MGSKLDDIIRKPKNSRKKRKRLGRGNATGHGTTAGRGTKGQRARSGGGVRPGFEGGQMPLTRRVPKRGFKSPFKEKFYIINLKDIEKKVEANTKLDIKTLVKYGFIEVGNTAAKKNMKIKILGKGDITKPVTIYTHKISKEAAKKILQVSGKIFILKENVKLDKKVLEKSDKDIIKSEYKVA